MCKRIVRIMLITLLCGVTFFPATSQAELTNVKDCIKNKSDCSELDSSGTDTKIDETKEKNDDNSTPSDRFNLLPNARLFAGFQTTSKNNDG